MHLTGDQIVSLVNALPTLIGSIVALIAAVKAGRRADAAQKSAEQAHAKAAQAAQQQINFALQSAARIASAGSAVSLAPPPPGEGGSV
jgi:hypothetical protein